MGNWTKTKAAGLLFVAAAAVYSDGLVRAMASEKATTGPADAGSETAKAVAAAPAVKPAPAAAPKRVAAAKPKAVAAKPAAAVATAKPTAKPAAKPTAAKPVAVAAKPAAKVAAKPAVKPAAPAKVLALAPAKAKPGSKAIASKVVASKVVANQAVEAPEVSATTADAATTQETATDTAASTQPAVDPFAETVNVPTETTVKAEGGAQLTDANVNVSDAGLVEIHVNDANLGEVLKMLSVQLERNIMASKEVRGTVTANLYDVTVKEALDAILRANDCGYREKGNVLYVYTKKELEDIEKAERKQVTETFRIYYTPAANAVTMIKPVLSPEAQVSFTTPAVTGIDAKGKDAGGNSHATEDTIVVTDFPDRIEAVRKVLKEVDRRPQQILVEAVILRATLKEDNELGVDFAVLGGVDFSNLLSPLGGGIIDSDAQGALADKGASVVQAGGSGLKVGVISNNVSVFVNALEGVTDTAVVANPKVLVLNKQPGSVHVGARLGYRTAVSTETLTADDVKFLEIGTRLNFRPYIGNDGYIRMEISPKDSSGNVTPEGLPNEFVTEVTSNVMVRDGRTIVIGGLFRESSDSNRSQVPGLGNLPIAGHLFKKQKDSTIREEVIILLTPHIIKDEDAYERMSEEELKSVERMRVGSRRGMMPWGRERLADSAYQCAVTELNKPNPDRKKALWHLDCATNLNPKFAEAMALKAQLTGEEVTASDGSSIRSFVQRNVMAERRTAASAAAMAPAATGAAHDPEPVAHPTTRPSAVGATAAEPDAGAADDLGETAEAPATQPSDAESTEVALEGDEATTQPTVDAEATADAGTEATAEEMPAETLGETDAEEATPSEVTTVEEPTAGATTEEPAIEVTELPVEEAAPVTETPADEVQDVLVEIEADDAAVNK